MWPTILFTILNGICSFVANYMINFSALDITPIAMAIIAWHGGNVVVSAFFITLSYAIVAPKEIRFLWLTLPLAIAVGKLAAFTDSGLLLIFFWHFVGFVFSILFAYFRGKYAMFMILNFMVNYLVAKIYYLFF